MGRKTFESIGHPLPDRHNIILTRNKEFCQDGAEVPHSPEQLLDIRRCEIILVRGGANVYSLLLRAYRKRYFSGIFGKFEEDSFQNLLFFLILSKILLQMTSSRQVYSAISW